MHIYVRGLAVIFSGRGIRVGDGVDEKCLERDEDGVLVHIWRDKGTVEEREPRDGKRVKGWRDEGE